MITLFIVLALIYLVIGFAFIVVSGDVHNPAISWQTQLTTVVTWPRYAKQIVDIIRHGF